MSQIGWKIKLNKFQDIVQKTRRRENIRGYAVSN